jgi:hypothetical protein
MPPNTPASSGLPFVTNKLIFLYEILVAFQQLHFADFSLNKIWAYIVFEDLQRFRFNAEPNSAEQAGSSLATE